jgi:hypothetical protein
MGAAVFIAAEGRRSALVRAQAAAKAWRVDAVGAARRGTLRGPSPVTVADAADALLAACRPAR